MRSARILLLSFLPLAPAWAGGGDDQLTWRSSVDAEGGPYGWPNPTSAGATDLALGTGGSTTVALPFSFPFYGSAYTSVTVHANGVVALSGAPGARARGDCVADGSGSAVFVAPWWREWDLDAQGTVWAKTYSGGLAVVWEDVIASGDTEGVSFAALLSDSGEITFVYRDANTGVSTSRRGRDGAIGVQSGADGLSVGCDALAIDKSASVSLWFTPVGLRTWAGEVTPDVHVDLTVLGASAGDEAGAAVSLRGDLDADGLADLVVGAPGASEVAVFAGSAAPSGSVSWADADVTISGGTGARLGAALDAGGDIDGDGVDDLLVGAPGDDVAWLLLGGALGGVVTESDADVLLSGEASGDEAGAAVALIGDMNGDGYGELAVGAPSSARAAAGAGAVYIVLGGASPSDSALSAAYARIGGVSADDAFGSAVAALGDADGDGRADLAVGAPGRDAGATGAGALYVVRSSALPSGESRASSLVTVLGDTASASAGASLLGLGDLNGDGLSDLIIGGPDASSGSGAAWLVKSKSSAGAWPTRTSSADGELTGATSGGLGWGLASIDLGDDGVPDLAIGAPDLDTIYVIDGDEALDASSSAPSLAKGTFTANLAGSSHGAAMAGGDFNGDGRPDLAVGAPLGNGDVVGAGAVTLLLAEPTYPDADSDGFISTSWGGLDCDDSNSRRHPGRKESCDGVDSNCDGVDDDGFDDTDLDGVADCRDVESCDGVDNDGDGVIDEDQVDADGDGVCDGLDAEACDGIDNDGDGLVDEGYADTDGDGTADCRDTEECDGEDNNGDGAIDEGYADTDADGAADCIDFETCDGKDNDGDGEVDEGFADTDGDGRADCRDGETCDLVDNDGDGDVDEELPDADRDGLCDELDSEDCDGLDNDGDRRVDEDFEDQDEDGVADCRDGEDCDGRDNNGDGVIDEGYPDTDIDGVADCQDTEGCDDLDNDGDSYVDEGMPDADYDGDCDGLETEGCDGLDNDGDTLIDEGFTDADEDGAADCFDPEECDGVDNDGDAAVDEGFADLDADAIADCVDPDWRVTPVGPGVIKGGGGVSCATSANTSAGGLGVLGALLGLLGALRRRRA
ncbi:FG-GAP-like repeat-containing protein [Myxococcota bacterium]|nr:FG-GAP-like repeat-containing protein [Myxococcota bacterium]